MDDLDRNISTQYYERRLAAQRESSTLPVPYTGQADPLEYIKNPMVAEFMGFHRDTNYSESELEQALLQNLIMPSWWKCVSDVKYNPSSLNL